MKNNQKRMVAYGRRFLLIATLVLILAFSVSAYDFPNNSTANVCCERTTYGASCQNAPVNQCDNNFRQAPTSCEATSFCKRGCCYDSDEGLCMENSPKQVCVEQNGVWAEDKKCNIAQCKMGCCVLGKQAAFVGLVRCKKLSSFYGLLTDFRSTIKTEEECIALAQSSDEGACVYEKDFEKSCKFTTRQNCKEITKNPGITNSTIKFYKDYLCSNPDLATNCGPSEKTTCVDGKDEIYFLDTCGNTANIYDSSKKNDTEYWRKIVPKALSCGAGKDNSNSKNCGNCDYFIGSICAKYDKNKDSSRPVIGDNICRNLDCKTTSLGIPKKHGETWCGSDSVNTRNGSDVAGSQYFRHICVFGEEIVEPCADFRQEQCIQNKIQTTEGDFLQAGCRVNRWQDCFAQTEEGDCNNTDKRDCYWLEDVRIPSQEEKASTTYSGNTPPITGNSIFGLGDDESSEESAVETTKLKKGACLPQIPPGLKFWDSGNAEATSICGQASQTIQVTYTTTGVIGGSPKCSKNCEAISEKYVELQNQVCGSLGDCGAKINIAGQGTRGGFEWIIDGKKKDLQDGLFDMMRAKLKLVGLSSEKKGGFS